MILDSLDEHKGSVSRVHQTDLEKVNRSVNVKFIASLNGENYRTSHAPAFQGKNTNVRFVRNKSATNRFEIRNLLPVGAEEGSTNRNCLRLCTDALKDPKSINGPNEINLSKPVDIGDPNALLRSPQNGNNLQLQELREFTSSPAMDRKKIPLVRSFSNKFASIPELPVMVKAVSDGLLLQANPPSNQKKDRIEMDSMEMNLSDGLSADEMKGSELPDLRERQFFNILKDNYDFLKDSKDFQNDEESFEIEIKKHSIFKPIDARKKRSLPKKGSEGNDQPSQVIDPGEAPVILQAEKPSSEVKGTKKIGTGPTTLNSVPKLVHSESQEQTNGKKTTIPSLNVGITSIQNLIQPINEEEFGEGSYNESAGRKNSVRSILKSNNDSRKGVHIKSRFKVSFKC